MRHHDIYGVPLIALHRIHQRLIVFVPTIGTGRLIEVDVFSANPYKRAVDQAF